MILLSLNPNQNFRTLLFAIREFEPSRSGPAPQPRNLQTIVLLTFIFQYLVISLAAMPAIHPEPDEVYLEIVQVSADLTNIVNRAMTLQEKWGIHSNEPEEIGRCAADHFCLLDAALHDDDTTRGLRSVNIVKKAIEDLKEQLRPLAELEPGQSEPAH
ncbi:hypothetical protein F5Y01DRAFT_310205 [Xylaria sp. FL0043]|nr:hypothetical protein F5Y01DRAFT_310205 [Xylaria sp. FL0043]